MPAVVERFPPIAIQPRSRSPEGSSNGSPLAWTRMPGACPQMQIRAVAESRMTGRGACPVAVDAKVSRHAVHALILLSRA